MSEARQKAGASIAKWADFYLGEQRHPELFINGIDAPWPIDGIKIDEEGGTALIQTQHGREVRLALHMLEGVQVARKP
jgi:hypothetical protein